LQKNSKKLKGVRHFRRRRAEVRGRKEKAIRKERGRLLGQTKPSSALKGRTVSDMRLLQNREDEASSKNKIFEKEEKRLWGRENWWRCSRAKRGKKKGVGK